MLESLGFNAAPIVQPKKRGYPLHVFCNIAFFISESHFTLSGRKIKSKAILKDDDDDDVDDADDDFIEEDNIACDVNKKNEGNNRFCSF